MAKLLNVPVGLIMKIVKDEIEVFVSSHTEGNPYKPGDKEYLENSGLYCETVIKRRDRLLVPNALKDDDWKNNPDIKLGMISYLGLPIMLPNGDVFGTICVLDNKENPFNSDYESLLREFKGLVENQLKIMCKNKVLQHANDELEKHISEIKTLRGFLPICTFCKKIRDDDGYWQAIESYITSHSDADFTHGVCDKCAEEHYKDVFEEQ